MTTKLTRLAYFIAMAVAILGCNSKTGNQMDENPAEAAETPGDVTRKNSQTNEEAEKNERDVNDEFDGEFAAQAAEAGYVEVSLGKLARERGKQPAIREFGEMMIKDHEAANSELKSIAERRGIILPERSSCNSCKENHDELAKLKGNEFDRKYIQMMLKGHRDAVALFSREASSGTDTDLKDFAAKTLRTINHHLDMVERMDGTPH